MQISINPETGQAEETRPGSNLTGTATQGREGFGASGTVHDGTSTVSSSEGSLKADGTMGLSGDTSDDTLVRVNGVQMTRGDALRLGAIQEQPAQQPQQPAQQAQAQVQDTTQANGSNGVDLESRMDAEGQQAMKALQAGGDDAAAVALSVANGEEISNSAVDALASRLGQEPEAVRETIGKAADSLSNEVENLYGISPESLKAFAEETQKMGDFKRAAQAHVMNGDASGYRALVTEFHASVGEREPSVAQRIAQASGLTSKIDPSKGTVVVSIPDVGDVFWRDAVEQGWMKLG